MRFALALLFAASLIAGTSEESAAAQYESALPQAASAERLSLLIGLCEMEFNRRDYRKANRWLREAEHVPDATSEDRLRLLNARAALHLVAGRLSAAEPELRKAAELAERTGARSTLAAVLHNLATIDSQTGRLSTAMAREREALRIWTEEGDSPLYIQRGWLSLSSMQGLAGDWKGAEKSLRHALALGETADVLSNYAVVLDRLHRREEAKKVRDRIPTLPATPTVVDARALPFERSDIGVTIR